jgi:hypothetical protein
MASSHINEITVLISENVHTSRCKEIIVKIYGCVADAAFADGV